MKSPNVKILIAVHKPYPTPIADIYLPIQVGKLQAKTAIKNLIGDNTGENISSKNPVFCELTALYWAWKNLNIDYVGLVHYRRYFKDSNGSSKHTLSSTTDNRIINQNLQRVLSPDNAQKLMLKADVILPTRRNYFIENLYDHYHKTMNPEPFIKVRTIIATRCPGYLTEFDLLKKRRSAHMFNMFIMKKDILDDYCSWLFPILFELEKQVDTTGWSDFQRRYIGRISELLLDVWINTNSVKYVECPIINIEPVNWIKKGTGFLMAKFFGRKYEKSW